MLRHCAQAPRLIPVAAIVFSVQIPFLPKSGNLLDRHALDDIQHNALLADIRRRNAPLVARPGKRRAQPQLFSGLSMRAPEASFKCDLPGFIRREGSFVVIVKFLGKAKLSVIKALLHGVDVFPGLCHRAQMEGNYKPVERYQLLAV